VFPSKDLARSKAHRSFEQQLAGLRRPGVLTNSHRPSTGFRSNSDNRTQRKSYAGNATKPFSGYDSSDSLVEEVPKRGVHHLEEGFPDSWKTGSPT